MFVAPIPRGLECLDGWSGLVSEMGVGGYEVYAICAGNAWVRDESLGGS